MESCKECKQIFVKKTNRQIYCKKECSVKYNGRNRKKFTFICKICNIEFTTKHKVQIFCSLKCSSSRIKKDGSGYEYDFTKYSEMGKKNAAKRNLDNTLLKNSIRQCIYCNKDYTPKKNIQKYCSRICFSIDLSFKIKTGIIKTNSNNRGKGEIYLSELCIDYFGKDDVLCNEKNFKDKNGGLWDADIIIKSLKIAILYDGIFHHKQVKKDHKLKQIQSRDKIKRTIIIENGYKFYTINDLGKFNKNFVKDQFDLFIHKLIFKETLNNINLRLV